MTTRTTSTIAVWLLALASLGVAALLAAQFSLMATSLDPTEIITAGSEPWVNAALACLAFGGLALVTVLGLFLWHRPRWKPLGLALVLAQTIGVSYVCVKVYAEYF